MRGINRIGSFSLIAVLLAVGCTSGNGSKGGGGSPSLGAAVASQGSFSLGQQGASYTITVSNTGTAPTSGTVTVVDPPTGFTVTAMSGTNWTCTLATTTCTYSNYVGAGQSFPPITVTGKVTSANGTPVSIPLSLSGGGASAVSVTPTPTVTVAAVALSITKSHMGNFRQSQTGATYTVKVSNGASAGATSGTVTVTEIPPSGGGLTVTGMAGTNWTCTVATLACTRSDSLIGGSSYNPITVTVNVTANATSPQVNTASVSGGNQIGTVPPATDSTTINGGGTSACPLPALGFENLLSGAYVAQFDGWSDSPAGPFQEAGAFVTDGTGVVTGGELDRSAVGVGVTSQPAPELVTISSGSCYQLGSDLRGLMIWNLPQVSGGTAPVTFAFNSKADGTGGGLMEFDDANPSTNPGTRGAGVFFAQTAGPFTLASFAGPYSFQTREYSPNGANTDYLRSAAIARFDASLGVVSNGVLNVASTNDGLGTQTNIDNQTFTGSFTAPADGFGRGTLTLSFTNFGGQGPLTRKFAYYMIDPNIVAMWMQSTDTPDNRHPLASVEVQVQAAGPPYGPSSINGPIVFNMTGADLSSSHNFTVTAIGQVTGDGLGGVSVKFDEVRNGNVLAMGTDTIPGGTFTVSPNGMGVLTFGNGKSFSVSMNEQNGGFLLEGTQASPGSNVIFGGSDPQRAPAGGFVDGTFSGLYGFGAVRPASTNSPVVEGSFTATPTTIPASLSGKMDHSSGAGCITGCLSAGQPVSATYSVDTNGRITITGSGGGPAVGWFYNQNRVVILSDTSDANGTILNPHR